MGICSNLNVIFKAPIVKNDGDRFAETVFNDKRRWWSLLFLSFRVVADFIERLVERRQHWQKRFGDGQL